MQINIHFADALEQMPSYVKFLKDILSNKRKLEEYEIVALTEECSAILQKKLPPKLKDLESFISPFTLFIENLGLEKYSQLLSLCNSLIGLLGTRGE